MLNKQRKKVHNKQVKKQTNRYAAKQLTSQIDTKPRLIVEIGLVHTHRVQYDK